MTAAAASATVGPNIATRIHPPESSQNRAVPAEVPQLSPAKAMPKNNSPLTATATASSSPDTTAKTTLRDRPGSGHGDGNAGPYDGGGG